MSAEDALDRAIAALRSMTRLHGVHVIHGGTEHTKGRTDCEICAVLVDAALDSIPGVPGSRRLTPEEQAEMAARVPWLRESGMLAAEPVALTPESEALLRMATADGWLHIEGDPNWLRGILGRIEAAARQARPNKEAGWLDAPERWQVEPDAGLRNALFLANAAIRDLADDLGDDCGCPTQDRSEGPDHDPACPIAHHAAAIEAARAAPGSTALAERAPASTGDAPALAEALLGELAESPLAGARYARDVVTRRLPDILAAADAPRLGVIRTLDRTAEDLFAAYAAIRDLLDNFGRELALLGEYRRFLDRHASVIEAARAATQPGRAE